MAAELIPASVITSVGSVGASPHDSNLRIADFWAEQTFETGDWFSAAALGVTAIRGVLAVSAVASGSADWLATVSVGDIDFNCEKRARAGAYAAGSAKPTAAASSDADILTLGAAFNGATAVWIQLLVEA